MQYFSKFAKWLSNKSAQPFACFLAFFIILVWGLFGLPFHFNNTWQLIISTLAAIISVLMLFIIQNSQNRHTIAIQLKLDEIIRATKGAHNEMMDIEKLTVVFLTRYKQNLRFENENPKIEERINSIQSVGKGKLEPIEPTLKYHRKNGKQVFILDSVKNKLSHADAETLGRSNLM